MPKEIYKITYKSRKAGSHEEILKVKSDDLMPQLEILDGNDYKIIRVSLIDTATDED